MTTAALITLAIIALLIILRHTNHPPIHRRSAPKPVCHGIPKPAWVRREIIRIKAHAHESGCRAVADIFNRRFAAEKGITVGKSYVSCILRNHSAEIINLRHKWKRRIPKPVPQNLVWAMDLTGITDSAQKTRNILGIIDHGTRK